MILTGDTIDVETAKEYGLISRSVAPEELMTAAKELALRVTANPAKALRMSKRLLREAQHLRLNDVLELSAAHQALAHETDDHSEAVDAFLEKRSPKFNGT